MTQKKLIRDDQAFVPAAFDTFGAMCKQFQNLLTKMVQNHVKREDEGWMQYKMGSSGAYGHMLYRKAAHALKLAVYKGTAKIVHTYGVRKRLRGRASRISADPRGSDYMPEHSVDEMFR